MSKGWDYKSGDWLVVCDSCSKKIKASKSKERWDGFRVCSECWEPRHPMDFIRARVDKISVPFTRPQTTDVFNEVTGFIDFWTVDDDFSRVWDAVRSIDDSITATDVITSFDFGKALSDSLTATDSLTLVGSFLVGLADSVTTTSSGNLFIFDYVDETYVGLDYVGSTVGTIS